MRRAVRNLSIALISALTIGLVLADRWFIRPRVDEPTRVDAVVVFLGPNQYARIQRGQALVDAGFASELAVSQPGADALGWDWLPRCQKRRQQTPLVICFDPVPDTTRGEARVTAALMRQEGWKRVIVVVGTDQVTRARLLLERCGVRDPVMIGVPSPWSRPKQALYQGPALVKAWVLRGC